MTFINRLLLVGLLSVGISAATTAQAGNQLFTAEWYTKSFGNELVNGTGESSIYSAVAIPHGIVCNPNQPRCPFDSTPTDGAGNFHPLGGSQTQALYCAPWYNFGGLGTAVRPGKDLTPQTTGVFSRPIPPLYRNPFFFTSLGEPKRTACNGTSVDVYTKDGVPVTPLEGTLFTAGGLTRYGHYKGLAQVGHPVTGTWGAATAGIPGKGGFGFGQAPDNHPFGIRTTGLVGEFSQFYPYIYSYTYATLKNDVGIFGPGLGPGSFNIKSYEGANPVATINVKQGAAKFGGVMRMLGAHTSKVCFYSVGGCSLGRDNWRYDAVGASAYYSTPTPGVYVVTKGYQALYSAVYYHTALMQQSSFNVVGSRFPWTTGSVTLKAGGRHKTVHYGQGYDNRSTTTMDGVINVHGTIQLVTPILTHWVLSAPGFNNNTGGIGILRIKFIPEPQMWAMLVAGISLLGVGTRMRGR